AKSEPFNLDKHPCQLACCFNAEYETALQVVFCIGEFLLANRSGSDFLDKLVHRSQCELNVLGSGADVAEECPFIESTAARNVCIGAVGQSKLVTEFAAEAVGKPGGSPENVVHDHQGVIVRIVALDTECL